MKFLQFKFIPQSTDCALLLLRVVAGLAMLILHGWPKVANFGDYSEKFMNFLGLGQSIPLGLAIFGELVCAALIVIGLLTRFAALGLGITMGVAFFMAHGGQLSGPGSGEMAMLYLLICAVIFMAGPGKFSLDGKRGGA